MTLGTRTGTWGSTGSRHTRRAFAGGIAALGGLGGALGLAACGASGTGAAPAQPTAGPASIEFYHEWDGVRQKLVQDMIVDFKAVQPNITVKETLVRGNIPSEKIFAAIISGTPPDVLMNLTHTNQVWAVQKGIRFLDDLIRRDKISTDQTFYKATVDLVRIDGKHTGLPALVAGVDPTLMYNRQIVSQLGLDPNKPPKTWQEAEEWSMKATQREGGALTRVGLVPTERGFWEWLYLNDGQLFTPDAKKVAFNTVQGQEALQFMADFTQRVHGGISAIQDFYKANRGSGAIAGRTPWYNGKEVLWVSLVSSFFRIDEEAKGFPLGAAQAPYNGKNPKAKVALVAERTWLYAIPTGVKQEGAAWNFLKYSTMEEGAKKFILAQQRPSPVRKINEDKAFRDLNPHWDVVVQNLNSSVPIPQTPAWDDVRASLIKMGDAVLAGKIGVKEALIQAADESQRALDQYSK
jgi:multiple sugar transport system substrate-binding protein